MTAFTSAQRDAPIVALAGGGTGGHAFPALAVAEAIRAKVPDARFLFFGTRRPVDRRVVTQGDIRFVEQPIGLRRGLWRWPLTLLDLRKAASVCRSVLSTDRPRVMFGVGGLGCVAPVREAVRLGIPIALLNPDVIPGRANRFLSRRADVIFVQWEEAAERFRRLPGRRSSRVRIEVTGCPVRVAFQRTHDKSAAARFGLDPHKKTLLVTGASQGARSVNRAVLACLPFLEERRIEWQVLHLTGEQDYDEVVACYGASGLSTKVLAFTEFMAEALAAADLVVARAGASTLAEIAAVGRASILMPYPYHRDRHQLENARCLVRASGARLVIDRVDPRLNAPALREALNDLMQSADARDRMAQACRRVGRPKAAETIADSLLGLAERCDSSAFDCAKSTVQPTIGGAVSGARETCANP